MRLFWWKGKETNKAINAVVVQLLVNSETMVHHIIQTEQKEFSVERCTPLFLSKEVVPESQEIDHLQVLLLVCMIEFSEEHPVKTTPSSCVAFVRCCFTQIVGELMVKLCSFSCFNALQQQL